MDLPQFDQEVSKKREHMTKEMRFADLSRIIVQEKGEQYYEEKRYSKMRLW